MFTSIISTRNLCNWAWSLNRFQNFYLFRIICTSLLVFRSKNENDDADMPAAEDPVEETNSKKELDELVIVSDTDEVFFILCS